MSKRQWAMAQSSSPTRTDNRNEFALSAAAAAHVDDGKWNKTKSENNKFLEHESARSFVRSTSAQIYTDMRLKKR